MPAITKIFSFSYLFKLVPPAKFQYYWILLIFFLTIFICSLILNKKIRKNFILKKLLKKKLNHLKILGIIGLILLFCRYTQIPYLSMRAGLLIIILAIIYVIARSIYVYQKEYPHHVQHFIDKKEKNKYLPQQKKK